MLNRFFSSFFPPNWEYLSKKEQTQLINRIGLIIQKFAFLRMGIQKEKFQNYTYHFTNTYSKTAVGNSEILITTRQLPRELDMCPGLAILSDVVHETINKAQEIYCNMPNSDANLYIDALRYNALHIPVEIKTDNEQSVFVDDYINNGNSELQTLMYLAQPTELQANTLSQEFFLELGQLINRDSSFSQSQKDLIQDVIRHYESRSMLELIRLGKSLLDGYDIVPMCANCILNFHAESQYQIHPKMEVIFRQSIEQKIDSSLNVKLPNPMFPLAPLEKPYDVLEIVMSGKDVLDERRFIEEYNSKTKSYIEEYSIGQCQNDNVIKFLELKNEDVSLEDIIRL